MEIEDFYKIIAKLEKEQERLSKSQTEIVEKITAIHTAQNKDFSTICKNQDVLSKQLNNLSTSKNASDSPELTKAIKAIHSDLNRQEELINTLMFRFWCLVGLVVGLFCIVEWQISQLPEQTAEQFLQMYAQQAKSSKQHSR